MAQNVPGKVSLRVIRGYNLPIKGTTYAVFTIGREQIKTGVSPSTNSPLWWQDFVIPIMDCSQPLLVKIAVYDHFSLKQDALVGAVSDFCITPSSSLGKLEKSLSDQSHFRGTISFELYYVELKEIIPQGPKLECIVSSHHVTSVVRGTSSEAFPVYQIKLKGVEVFYGQTKYGWNRNYEAAQKIFGSTAAQAAITLQHHHLYNSLFSEKIPLKSGDDFLELIKMGVRKWKMRFFTYCITVDGDFNFAETGAQTGRDFTSKHAMHSACQPDVRFAGEFFVTLDPKGYYVLVVDNNSGTYAPPKEGLAPTKALLEASFPGLHVHTVHWQDEELKANKDMVSEQHAQVTQLLPKGIFG